MGDWGEVKRLRTEVEELRNRLLLASVAETTAVLAEREACAELVGRVRVSDPGDGVVAEIMASVRRRLAAVIRARGGA